MVLGVLQLCCSLSVALGEGPCCHLAELSWQREQEKTTTTTIILTTGYCIAVQVVRAVPEIILRGGHIFFQTPPPPRTHRGVRAPRPPGHVSALIKLPHYGSNMPWPPGQVTPAPPTPRTYCQQNTLPPLDKKVCGPPTPEDNFWNSPNAGGTSSGGSTGWYPLLHEDKWTQGPVVHWGHLARSVAVQDDILYCMKTNELRVQ